MTTVIETFEARPAVGRLTPFDNVERRAGTATVDVIGGQSKVINQVNPAPRDKGFNYTLAPGMITDYYQRIFVTPSLFELQNPAVGVGFAYTIWNAFFVGNTLSSVTATNGDGLVTGVTPPVSFDALQQQTFEISITPQAPLTIDATFAFNFTLGVGRLQFIASRANVVDMQPEEPIEQTVSWSTNVLRAHDGTEQRISTRPLPRRAFRYNIILPDDDEIRQTRRTFHSALGSPVVLPQWHEGFEITNQLTQGATVAQGDFSQGLWCFRHCLRVQSVQR